MPLGLLYTDIINSFAQTQESDFAVGSISGATIINSEINFQYSKLLNSLPSEVLNMMDTVSGEVASVNISGSFAPTLYAIPETLRGYIVPGNYSPCPGVSLEGYTTCWQNALGTQYASTPANISAAGLNQYQILDTFDRKTQKLVIYYDVDQTNLSINSLKTFLRDLVCASLGARLFPVGNSDQWSIVNYYQAEADKYQEFLKGGGVPSEFAKLRYVGKTNGIYSEKIRRS